MHQNNIKVAKMDNCACSDKFVSLSQCDLRANILPFFLVLTGKKSEQIYIGREPEFLSRYQPELELVPELKYRRLHIPGRLMN